MNCVRQEFLKQYLAVGMVSGTTGWFLLVPALWNMLIARGEATHILGF